MRPSGCSGRSPIRSISQISAPTRQGAPVKLAIGLDSVFQTTLSGKVGRYINFYIGNGAGTRVARGKNLQGQLSNVDVAEDSTVSHINIDKSARIQAEITREIGAVAKAK